MSRNLSQSTVNATNNLDRLAVSARGGEWRDPREAYFSDETKLGQDETIFHIYEDIPKRPVGITALTKRRAETAH
jgi:hypothetical protein